VVAHLLIPRLSDIIEAIERIRSVMGDTPLEAFETDWQKQWLVERGVEIVSEASHPQIPWRKVAGIGNILRHDYGRVAAPVMWTLVRENLASLERVCRDELAAALGSEQAPEAGSA
jgi:uncharacterized protein with HEPN domain